MLKNKLFFAQDTIIESLYVLAFSFHTLWIYIITDDIDILPSIINGNILPLVTNMAEHAKEIYEYISMDLSGDIAFILSEGTLSSLVLNTIRRLSESLFLGWPRYKGRHSINSLIYAKGRVLFYIVFVFF